MSYQTKPMYLGLEVVVSPFVSDYESVKRSWKERLFTLPWRPFTPLKTVYNPKIYQLGDKLMMSPKTCSDLMKEASQYGAF